MASTQPPDAEFDRAGNTVPFMCSTPASLPVRTLRRTRRLLCAESVTVYNGLPNVEGMALWDVYAIEDYGCTAPYKTNRWIGTGLLVVVLTLCFQRNMYGFYWAVCLKPLVGLPSADHWRALKSCRLLYLCLSSSQLLDTRVGVVVNTSTFGTAIVFMHKTHLPLRAVRATLAAASSLILIFPPRGVAHWVMEALRPLAPPYFSCWYFSPTPRLPISILDIEARPRPFCPQLHQNVRLRPLLPRAKHAMQIVYGHNPELLGTRSKSIDEDSAVLHESALLHGSGLPSPKDWLSWMITTRSCTAWRLSGASRQVPFAGMLKQQHCIEIWHMI